MYNMDYTLYLGIGIYILIIVATRFLDESALKFLSTEEKGKMIEQMAGMRKYQIIILAILMGGYLTIGFMDKFAWLSQFGSPITMYFVAIGLYVITLQILSHRKKVQLAMPKEYLKRSLISGIVRNIGMLIFLYSLAKTL